MSYPSSGPVKPAGIVYSQSPLSASAMPVGVAYSASGNSRRLPGGIPYGQPPQSPPHPPHPPSLRPAGQPAGIVYSQPSLAVPSSMPIGIAYPPPPSTHFGHSFRPTLPSVRAVPHIPVGHHRLPSGRRLPALPTVNPVYYSSSSGSLAISGTQRAKIAVITLGIIGIITGMALAILGIVTINPLAIGLGVTLLAASSIGIGIGCRFLS